VRPVVDVMVEQERVRAADERHLVLAHELEELGLAEVEAPLGVRLEVPVEGRRAVHQHDLVRLLGRLQPLGQERQRLVARPGDPAGLLDGELPDPHRRGVERDEAGVPVGEVDPAPRSRRGWRRRPARARRSASAAGSRSPRRSGPARRRCRRRRRTRTGTGPARTRSAPSSPGCAQAPGSEDPANAKNQMPNSTSATPTEMIITLSSTDRRRLRSRSPRIDFIHAACCGLPSSSPVIRPW
jgi:hypothetical protein